MEIKQNAVILLRIRGSQSLDKQVPVQRGKSVYLEMCSNGGGLCFTLLTVLFT